MRIRILTLSLTILCLALSANSTTLFTSGPINGNLNGFFVDGPNPGPFEQWLSNGFVDTTSGMANQVSIGLWTLGGAPTTVSYEIGSTSFGGPGLAVGTGLSNVFLFTNSFGYSIYQTTFNITPTALTAGTTYYLSIGNVNDVGGSQFDAWDDIESPSASCYFQNPSGSGGCPTTESEAFTISGGQPTTPEPSSILLFGSGILGLAGVLRRKLNR
ncbi:MAG: PEP-CTERM sorting domain-containing protein [Candidatus Korobacteraceae bacterium]